jgi:hypothetical protein
MYIVLRVDTIKIMQLRAKPFDTDHIDCKIWPLQVKLKLGEPNVKRN